MRLPASVRVSGAVLALGLAAASCTNASTSGTSKTPAEPATSSAAADPAVSEEAAALLPADVKDKGVITVAMDASYPPFQYFENDNKTIIGFDVDLSNALAERLGIDAEQVNAGFDTILPGLAAGKYDAGESAFSVTPEREKTVDFVTYLNAGSGIAVAKGNPLGLEMDPAQLCGRKVAAQKGSTQGIAQLPAISEECAKAGDKPVAISLFPSQNDANLALTSGRVDAVMADSFALAYAGQLANGAFELAPGEDYEPAPMGIALPKGSELKPALEAAFASLIEDGTYAELIKKWDFPESAIPTSAS
jgi:polar amino acid transport system substrate-binding protein